MTRTQSVLTSVLCTASIAATASAQSVDSVAVIKFQLHTQTFADEVSLNDPISLPYGIGVNVEGDDIDLLAPAPTVSGPITVSEPTHNGGMLGYNDDDDAWRYGAPSFNDYGTETLAELDALFGTGTYTLTVDGVTIPLVLGPAVYPAAAPLVTLTGGAWVGSEYRISPDQELTVSSSPFVDFDAGVNAATFLGIFGDEFETESISFASDGTPKTVSLTVPAGTLTDGECYFVDAIFTIATDFRTDVPSLPGALVAAGYENATSLKIVVGSSGCNPADLAEPLGTLDLADIVAFVTAFTTQDPDADLDPNGLFDLSDIVAFVTAFNTGCP